MTSNVFRQKVVFPLRLDISSLCSETLRKKIEKHRDAVDAKADAQREANEAKLLETEEKDDDAMKVDVKEDKSKPRKQANPCTIILNSI